MEALSHDELRGKTREFQTRIQEEVAAGKPVNAFPSTSWAACWRFLA